MVTWAAAQVGLAAAAVFALGAGAARRTAAATLPWLAPLGPLPRALLCFVGLLPFLKTIEIAATPGPWPAWRRLWHGLVPFDVRGTPFVKPAVDGRILGNIILHGAIASAAFVAIPWLDSGPARDAARLLFGTALVYAWIKGGSEIVRFGHRCVGIEVPPIQRSPILSRGAREFWGERWNRPWSDWLHRFAFRPLARRRHPALAVLAAFGVSAAIHAWMFAVALGGQAAAMVGAFFLIQGVVVLAETYLRLRTWPAPASRAWTFFVLLGPLPLFLDPFLGVLAL